MSSSKYVVSLGSHPFGVNHTKDQPTNSPPSYSLVNRFRWWEEAAEKIIQTMHDFDLITRTIKFIPILDHTAAATLLSRRQKPWLGAFLKFLCRKEAIDEPCCDSPVSTAEAIVAIIRPMPSPYVLRLEQSGFLSPLLSSNIHTAAENLDYQIHVAFCKTTFLDWTAWLCGCPCAIISDFLDALFNFRNALVHYAQQRTLVAENLRLLQRTLRSQQPLVCWIITSAISCDTSSDASEALRFFLEPIAQQFNKPSISSSNTAEQLNKQCFSIAAIGHKLSILDTRFRLKIVHEPDPKWPIPFSTDFSLWESIQSGNPQDLAESSTKSVATLFLNISTTDLLSEDGCLKDVARTWSDLADDFFACLNANRKLTTYLMQLAENFICLGNLFSAAAIGLALLKWGYRPQKPSRVWDIINPEDNFAGCREFVVKNRGCLAPMYPYIRDLRQSGNAPKKILEYYQMIVGFLERAQGPNAGPSEKLEGKAVQREMTGHQYLPHRTTSSSSFWALQRMVTSTCSNSPETIITKEKIENNIERLNVHPSNKFNFQSTNLYKMTQQVDSFTLFPKLPLELQHKIWKKACLIHSSGIPSVLHVSAEARKIVLTRLGVTHDSMVILIPKIQTFYELHPCLQDCKNNVLVMLAYLPTVQQGALKFWLEGIDGWRYHKQVIVRFRAMLPNNEVHCAELALLLVALWRYEQASTEENEAAETSEMDGAEVTELDRCVYGGLFAPRGVFERIIDSLKQLLEEPDFFHTICESPDGEGESVSDTSLSSTHGIRSEFPILSFLREMLGHSKEKGNERTKDYFKSRLVEGNSHAAGMPNCHRFFDYSALEGLEDFAQRQG